MQIKELDIEQLNRDLDALEATQACRNIIGKLSYYRSAFRNNELVDLWANLPDSILDCAAGRFEGIDAIRSFFLNEVGDRSSAAVAEKMQGVLIMHEIDTEVLTVSEDGSTAHGVWFSPGNETVLADSTGNEHPDYSQGVDALEARCYWLWDKVSADFIRIENEWKLKKLVVEPLFRTRFETPWTETDVQSESRFWQWSPDAVFPEQQF